MEVLIHEITLTVKVIVWVDIIYPRSIPCWYILLKAALRTWTCKQLSYLKWIQWSYTEVHRDRSPNTFSANWYFRRIFIISNEDRLTGFHVAPRKKQPKQQYTLDAMMTSSNGNIFHITGPLWGESTVTGGFPWQRSVTWGFGAFFDLRLNKRLSQHIETPVTWDAIALIMTQLWWHSLLIYRVMTAVLEMPANVALFPVAPFTNMV